MRLRPPHLLLGLAVVALMAAAFLWPTSGPAGQSDDPDRRATGTRSPSGSRQPGPATPTFVPFDPREDRYALAVDPDDPNYDPTALLVARNMRAAELFKAEKRNPGWAPLVERRIDQTLGNDFSSVFPGMAFDIKSECASSTCMVQVNMPAGMSEAARMVTALIPQWANLGTSVEVEGSGDSLHFGMTISKDWRDLAEFDRSMAQRRNEIVRKIQEMDRSKITDPRQSEAYELLSRLTPIEAPPGP